jgi:hypothetical protein
MSKCQNTRVSTIVQHVRTALKTTQIRVRGTVVALQFAHSSASCSCILALLLQAKANEYYQQAIRKFACVVQL